MRPRPYGLRDTCLKVRYLALSRVHVLARAARPSLLKTVAGWRVRTPTPFADLCALLQIRDPPLPARRPHAHSAVTRERMSRAHRRWWAKRKAA